MGRRVSKTSYKMMQQFDGHYDAHLCCCLADEYQNGCKGDQELLHELLIQISPLVGMVSKLEVSRHIAGESRDSLCVDALAHVWELFESSSIPTDHIRQFTSFLYTTIKRTMIDSLRDCALQVFDFGAECEDPPYGELPTYKQVDARVQLGQIKLLVKAIFDHDCRFVGKERQACKFMVLCQLGMLNQDPMAAQHRFKLTKLRAKQLHAYARIQVKSLLYLLKDMHEGA